jgi:hypothetical protein
MPADVERKPTMRTSVASVLVCGVLIAGLAGPGLLGAQQNQAPAPAAKKVAGALAPGPETIESINQNYDRELGRLERQRLDRLARLAAVQGKEEADKTYQAYFQHAIAGHLYREAEPIAERVLESTNPSTQLAMLAAIVNIIAEADRGAHDESLASLAAAFQGPGRQGNAAKGRPQARFPRATRMVLADAYYQRLVQAGRFDIARKAFELIKANADDAVIEQYAAGRLRQLDFIGKPAPLIAGTDVDGKAVGLEGFKGDVILVVFWATWYVPGAEDVAWLDRVYETYKGRGFRILGVNLDASQDGGQKLDTVMPNIKRFLIDHNVRWPNLVNQPGDRDYAKAYGVTEVPANVLIGRDGTVIYLDLTRSNLEAVVAKALGQ